MTILSFSFQQYFDFLVEFAKDNLLLILLVAFMLPFIEALLPFLPLVAIVSVDIVLLSSVVAGPLGTVLGIAVAAIGSFAGTSTVYLVIRNSIGRWFRRKVEDKPKVKSAMTWIDKRSNLFMILIMSNPYTPSSVFNYAMALSNFPPKRYLIITGISRVVCVGLLGLLGIIFKVNDSLMAFVWITITYVGIYLVFWLVKKNIHYLRRMKMKKKTIKDVNLNEKTVLIRVDFNVPMKDGVITDENRIVQALPTIKYALEQNAKLVLFSHLGRVKEEADKAKNTLAPVAKRLAELLGQEVKFIPETRGAALEAAVKAMAPRDIVMFENTRFEDLDGKKESKNDPELGKYWASLGDIFVNDAFGTAHRAHASNAGIAANCDTVVAGFLMEKEIEFIGGAVDNPVRPFIAILGGAKVSDKISVIENLINRADKILICGAMAYTFYKALGYEVGTSKCELDFVDFAKGLLEKADGKIILPIDTVVAKEFDPNADATIVDSNKIPADQMGMDIGPKTLELFAKELVGAKTVVWNGPAGVFEFDKFAVGTNGICEILANLQGATTIIGGGDSAAAAIKLGYEKKFTHISTGGGASLEYLEGKALPGVEILDDKKCGCGHCGH